MSAPGSKSMDEADFQAGVIEYAGLTGWLVFHVSDSRKEVRDRLTGVSRLVGDALARGFPDLLLCHPKRGLVLFRELKSDTGRVRPDQRAWLEALAACGMDAGIWRPRDLNTIEAVLSGRKKEAA